MNTDEPHITVPSVRESSEATEKAIKEARSWTAEQQAVIEHYGAHAIVTAVAGSGKTSTLVAHVLRQMARGQDPRRILVLMFNRSAREDFQKKLTKAAVSEGQPRPQLPTIRTYHAMGLKLYQLFAGEGLLPGYQGEPLSGPRMDFECWKLLVRIAPASLQDSLKNNKSSWVSELTGFIDLVKSTIKTPERVFEEYEYENRKKLLLDAYHAFERWRLDQRLITYADMLYQPVMLMVQQPELVQRISNRMDLMLVDEYQDTNEVQHTLLQMIAGRRAQVMVVGDPDQTIYEFRGARPEYILRTFSEDFPNPQAYTLSYTFRYGHSLALMADHLITRNQGRGDALCVAHPTTPQTSVERVENNDHARWLTDKLKALQEGGRPLSDITVLVRLWSQAVTLELALLETGTPFVSEAEKSAFDRQEIQMLISLLELASGRFATLPPEQRYQKFWQLLRFPHIGIRDEWLKGLCQNLSREEGRYGHWLMQQSQRHHEGVSDFQKNRMLERGRLWVKVEKGEGAAARLLKSYIAGVDLKTWLRESALDRDRAEEQLLAIDSFVRYLEKSRYLAEEACSFIEELNEKRLATKTQRRKKRDKELLLTSMHKAKGLEWPVVILPGLLDKQLPCSMGEDVLSDNDVESERRLFYVAMTRAREQLYLVTTPTPAYGSQTQSAVSSDRMPSRFMGELRCELSNTVGSHLYGLKKTSVSEEVTDESWSLDYPPSVIVDKYLKQADIGLAVSWSDKGKSLQDELSLPWQRSRVNHSIFGEGVVLSETGTDFKVCFDDTQQVYDFSKKSAHLYFV